MHLTRSVMILEPISDATLRAKQLVGAFIDIAKLPLNRLHQKEETKLHASAPELTLVGSSTPSEPAKPKQRKGPKGPNPLSVKKKKPSVIAEPPPPSIDSRPAGGKRKAEHDDLEFAATKRKRKRRKRAVVEIDQSENTVLNTPSQ